MHAFIGIQSCSQRNVLSVVINDRFYRNLSFIEQNGMEIIGKEAIEQPASNIWQTQGNALVDNVADASTAELLLSYAKLLSLTGCVKNDSQL